MKSRFMSKRISAFSYIVCFQLRQLIITQILQDSLVRTKTIIYKLTHSYYTKIHLLQLVISEVFINYTFLYKHRDFVWVSLSTLMIFLIWALYCAFHDYDLITTSEGPKFSSHKCDNFYRPEMTSNS